VTPSPASSGETQPERTALAWQRTGLGMMAVAGLLGHGAVEREDPVLLVLAGTAALLALTVLGGLAPVRYRQVRRMVDAGTGAVAPRLGAAEAAVVSLVAVAALAALVILR
jgi:putative membrane protein